MPKVFATLEELARLCHARNGSIGAFIEDKNPGTLLLPRALRRQMAARATDSKLTAMGKDKRAISVAGYVHFDLGDVPPSIRVGHDHAGVDLEGLAAHDAYFMQRATTISNGLRRRSFLAKPAMAVLGKRRMVGNVALEAQSAEPAIGEIEVKLLAEPTLRRDAEGRPTPL